jgi:hypothetical protein
MGSLLPWFPSVQNISTFPASGVTSRPVWDSTPLNKRSQDSNNQHKHHMNQQPKTEKKPKTKSKVHIRDLKPKKDAKGGELSLNFTKIEKVYRP